VELGVHLPIVDLGDGEPTYARLRDTVGAARDCGFAAVSANDHLVFARPWLDGPTALASVVERSGDLGLALTAALPVVRGPVALAKALAAIDVLSGGRLVAALAPGSSERDHVAAGVPFAERWTRFDASLAVVRSLLHGGPSPGDARHYALPGNLVLEPRRPVPLWVASWGSDAGLRRVARAGDGWLASAYNTTPGRFAAGRARLAELREGLPSAVATMWTWVTDDRAEADRVLTGTLAPLLRRDARELREQVCVGPPEHCARLLSAYAAAGCGRVYLWPLGDEPRQLERLAGDVVPLIGARRPSGGSRPSR
jgi:alkanesulfonate monooxygenase SsuD/methylene tetrahydromethanopterin reductase-like flavin-dependent oxidoreductase (luciferase family)